MIDETSASGFTLSVLLRRVRRCVSEDDTASEEDMANDEDTAKMVQQSFKYPLVEHTDGEDLMQAVIRIHSRLLLLASVMLLVLALVTLRRPRFAHHWLMPFSTVMFAWRLAIIEMYLASLEADPSFEQLAMPSGPVATAARRVVAAVLVLLILCSGTRAGIAAHAVMMAAYMLLFGAQYESTSQHWLLIELIGASGHVALQEIALSLVHVLCGLQKLNATFLATFPGYVHAEVHRVARITLPTAISTVGAWLAPTIELLGGTLVIAAWAASRRRRRPPVLRAGVLGNALIASYHASANTLLYGSETLGVYMVHGHGSKSVPRHPRRTPAHYPPTPLLSANVPCSTLRSSSTTSYASRWPWRP